MNPCPWPPDWTNAGHYPDPNKTSPLQWAWEFLRRNQEYQDLWEKLIESKYKRLKATKALRRPALMFERKFHITKTYFFPPPCPSENDPTGLSFDVAFILERSPSDAGPAIPLNYGIDSGEMMVVFNLNYPVMRQLKVVREALLSTSKEHKNVVPKFRRRIEHYQTYLRLLDARAAGASRKEILATLYRTQTNSYPNYCANKSLRDDIAAAERLRQKDFWLIAVTAYD
jgi:hypothetical protein